MNVSVEDGVATITGTGLSSSISGGVQTLSGPGLSVSVSGKTATLRQSGTDISGASFWSASLYDYGTYGVIWDGNRLLVWTEVFPQAYFSSVLLTAVGDWFRTVHPVRVKVTKTGCSLAVFQRQGNTSTFLGVQTAGTAEYDLISPDYEQIFYLSFREKYLSGGQLVSVPGYDGNYCIEKVQAYA